MPDVTELLNAIQQGRPQAADSLLPLIYDELRRLARQKLAQEQPGQTLQATALVHEAYLRLVPGGPGDRGSGLGTEGRRSEESPLAESPLAPNSQPLTPSFSSRGHFFAAAAEAMRRILVEAARSRARLKRGGQAKREELCESLLASDVPTDDLLGIHEALGHLEEHDPQAAQLVKLRYFAGMQHQEAADALGISRRTADGLWTLARAWLRRELKT